MKGQIKKLLLVATLVLVAAPVAQAKSSCVDYCTVKITVPANGSTVWRSREVSSNSASIVYQGVTQVSFRRVVGCKGVGEIKGVVVKIRACGRSRLVLSFASVARDRVRFLVRYKIERTSNGKLDTDQ